jgi:Fe-S-cluster containining protein
MPSDEDAEKAPGASVFACRQCGECCIGYGGTFVNDQDIERISTYIGTDPHGFAEQFCCLSGGRSILAQQDDGHCVFWDKACTIHPVKPQMCRKWPYIESLLIDFDNWNIMASMCPGMKKDVPHRVVKAWVKKIISDPKP